MHIIFDFDGTISNSIKGIQTSFDESFLQNFGISNTVDLYPLIGPPIHLILLKIRPQTTEDEMLRFVADFRRRYDTSGHTLNTLYPDIEKVIKTLRDDGHNLYIATFKRRSPLIKIMDEYNFSLHFSGIYTYDKADGNNYASKADMVKDLIHEHDLKNQKICLVGDSQDDCKAANENNIPFIFASYGYGKNLPAAFTIEQPIELLQFIPKIAQS